MTNRAIQVENLGKRYNIGEDHRSLRIFKNKHRFVIPLLPGLLRKSRDNSDPGHFWALSEVSFDVDEGEVLGLIGRNGAGKSTLLKILSRITEPTTGRARIYGRAGSLLEVGTGFHPELTGRENVLLNGAILGMKKSDINRQFDNIVEFAGVERFIDTPIKRYSSGMYVRLAFAVAAHLEPDILFVDEVLAVGDAEFQQKCLGRMREVSEQGRTVVFVSHNLGAIMSLCTRAIVLERGRVSFDGDVKRAVEGYLGETSTSYDGDLVDRADRSGDGRLRFTAIAIQSEQGLELSHVRMGTPLQIRLSYTGESGLKRVRVSVKIKDIFGQTLITLYNVLVGSEFAEIPSTGTFVCDIPGLPLAPDKYAVEAWCSVSGQTADLVGAAELNIVDADFFGTGRTLSASKHGAFALHHAWHVE